MHVCICEREKLRKRERTNNETNAGVVQNQESVSKVYEHQYVLNSIHVLRYSLLPSVNHCLQKEVEKNII